MTAADLAIIAGLVFAWGTLPARPERFDMTAPIVFTVAGVPLTHGPLTLLGITSGSEVVKVPAGATLVLLRHADLAGPAKPDSSATACASARTARSPRRKPPYEPGRGGEMHARPVRPAPIGKPYQRHGWVALRACAGTRAATVSTRCRSDLWVPKTYATRRYSCMTPPARSRRRTRK